MPFKEESSTGVKRSQPTENEERTILTMKGAASNRRPLRSCRVCRTQKFKTELTRWTLVDGELKVDASQTAPGRGYYSCSDKCAEILPKTIKRKK